MRRSILLRAQTNQLNNILQYQVNLLNTAKDNAWKIEDIHNFADAQAAITVNDSSNIAQILETTGNSAQKLLNIVNTLSNLKDTSTFTAGVVRVGMLG